MTSSARLRRLRRQAADAIDPRLVDAAHRRTHARLLAKLAEHDGAELPEADAARATEAAAHLDADHALIHAWYRAHGLDLDQPGTVARIRADVLARLSEPEPLPGRSVQLVHDHGEHEAGPA